MKLLTTLALSLSLLVGVAAAQTPPDVLVKETTDRVLNELEERKAQLKQNPGTAGELVREIVLPHFDFALMSRLVLARNWRTATPEQQERFTEQFQELLIRTYGTSLAAYSGQKVNYLPMQPSPDENRAVVRTEIRQSDGPAIPLHYMLRQGRDGWKVFDVVIDGVSLVQNYRTSFASEIQQRGLDGLIERLVERNRNKQS